MIASPQQIQVLPFGPFWNFFSPKYFQLVIDCICKCRSQGYGGPTVVLHYRNNPQFIYYSIIEGHLNCIMFLLLLLSTVLPRIFFLTKVYIQEWICWVTGDVQLYKVMLTVSQSDCIHLFSEPHAWELTLLGFLDQTWFCKFFFIFANLLSVKQYIVFLV